LRAYLVCILFNVEARECGLLVVYNLKLTTDAGRWSLTLLTTIHRTRSNQEDNRTCMSYIAWCTLYLLLQITFIIPVLFCLLNRIISCF